MTRPLALAALHLVVLWAFAVAQPLFDLLSREPSFFVIRGSRPADVLFLTLFLTVLAPCAPVLVSVTARMLGRRPGLAAQGLLVAGLLSALFLPALHRLTPVSGISSAVVAVVLGVSGSILYIARASVRRYLTVLSLVLLLFPAYFLLKPAMRNVVFLTAPAAETLGVVQSSTPIVMVIFDELPLVSLLDEQGRIDPSRYPSFAALAEGATWYRNATTVSDLSQHSVPSILTGRFPKDSLTPSFQDHPHNLFRLLAGSHDFWVFESESRLCPESLCQGSGAPFTERMRSLLSDVWFVYLHILLPEELTTSLPAVTRNWHDFGDLPRPSRREEFEARKRRRQRDRSLEFSRFIEGIRPTPRPTLYFIHSMLPHQPLTYLPSGKTYPTGGGVRARRSKFWWAHNESAITHQYQRHLLQTGFVDTLLGRLMARLRESGLYDSSLIAVTADHGISFLPKGAPRRLSHDNSQDILLVPLLIKAPWQRQGKIDDRLFMSVDILPTMAALLGADITWQTDGRSVLDPSSPVERQIVAFSTLERRWSRKVIPPGDLDRRFESVRRKVDLFGSGEGWYRAYKAGRYGHLVGRHVDEIGVAEKEEMRIDLSLTADEFILRADAQSLPARIFGSARSRTRSENPFYLAVAINGLIQAVTRVDGKGLRRGTSQWEMMLSETSFRQGRNSIRLFVVEEVNDGSRLRPVKKVFAAIPLRC